jgi:hypothetical protein
MTSLSKKIEVVANVAIIVVAILLGVVLVRTYLRQHNNPGKPSEASPIAAGTHLSMAGVDWKTNQRTLVLALSTQCHFCTESAPFYKQISTQRGTGLRLLAVFPQPVSEGEDYLKKLGVPADEVQQLPLSALSVSATPTLILADGQGVVVKSWVGKLPGDKAAEVLGLIK